MNGDRTKSESNPRIGAGKKKLTPTKQSTKSVDMNFPKEGKVYSYIGLDKTS